jgi:hypothetical protein
LSKLEETGINEILLFARSCFVTDIEAVVDIGIYFFESRTRGSGDRRLGDAESATTVCRVDMRAHIRLRRRMKNMRMLMRVAIAEGLKAT